MNDIHIVPMTQVEISGIAALEAECFSKPWSASSLESELENQNARFFVAVSSGEVLGYVGCIFVCGEGSITNIAVKASARRRGVASLLLIRLIETAKAESATEIFLEVRRSNLAAQKLYQKFGFSICGERRSFYRAPLEDAYIMKLSI